MPRTATRPVAFLIEGVVAEPAAVMIDHGRAVQYASWKHGRVSPLVRESALIEANERIAELERLMRAAGIPASAEVIERPAERQEFARS